MDFQRTYDERPADLEYGPTVLIVDDEEIGRTRLDFLCSSIKSMPPRVLMAASIPEALKILATTQVHVMLLDKNLGPDDQDPDQNGILSIPRFRQIQSHLQIVVITGSTDSQDAANAMSLGAYWFLPKTMTDDEIGLCITKAVDVANLEIQRERDKAVQTAVNRPVDLAGRSFAITKLKAQLRSVSESNRPVLLLGETGCGKTTAAKLINEYRREFLKQRDRPFFAVNMGAVSADLAERELFGNDKGAFTGADSAKPGLFELANGGTLFLDEIGEAPLDLQVKLLKVIEEGEYMRLGGQTKRHTSFKLICATNRNLEEMIERGEFREDLYMRISNFVVQIPGLAERTQDIPDIIRSLLPKCSADSNIRVTFEDLPADFVEYLTNTPQRGNIRGIEHQLSRLFAYAPKDKRDRRPCLTGWKEIPGMMPARRVAAAASSHGPITLKELMSRPFDVVGDGFPGLGGVVTAISDKIMMDALDKYPRIVDAAAVLQISVSKVSQDRKRFRGPAKGTNTNEPKPAHQTPGH